MFSYCRFSSAPYSRLFNAAQDLELTVQQFTLEGGSSLEGGNVAGGRYCRGRVEMSALYLEWLVRVYRIALPGQNHPPGTRSTLRRCLRERVAGVSTRSGGCIRLWRVEMSREGGTVGVVPGTACEGVQDRPPRTKSPSRNRNTLQRGEGDKNTLPRRLGGWEPM